MHQSSSEPDAGSCQSGDSPATNTACYPAAEGLQIQPMKPWIWNSFFTTKLTPNAIQPSADTLETKHFLKTTSKAEHFAARNCLMKRPFSEVKLNNSIAFKGVSSSISKRKKPEEEASERFLVSGLALKICAKYFAFTLLRIYIQLPFCIIDFMF